MNAINYKLNIPIDLYDLAKERASLSKLSLAQYIRSLLKKDLLDPSFSDNDPENITSNKAINLLSELKKDVSSIKITNERLSSLESILIDLVDTPESLKPISDKTNNDKHSDPLPNKKSQESSGEFADVRDFIYDTNE